jgi:16S rRNA (guanine1207-N2)-methyltransferase
LTAQSPSHSQWRASTTTVAGRVVTYHARPGLPGGPDVSPAALLLAHECAKYADPVCCFDVAFGLPALAFPNRQIDVITRHAGMAASIAHTAPAVTVLPDSTTLAPGHYQTILIEVPPTREAWRQRLCQAWALLAPGGVLVACGANDAGGKIAASDVKALFGRCNEQSKHHQRLVTAIKPAALASQPAWFDQPGIARDSWTHIDCHGRRYVSQAGVFAHDRVDAGSAWLCQHLPALAGQRVLDLGAGAGILGGWALDAGAALVDLIDVDAHAVASMRRTFADCPAVRVAWGDVLDGLPWPQQYDVIVSNPPFHAGKQRDDAMVRAFVTTAAQHLARHGAFWLVANAFLPYRALLSTAFSEVTSVATTPAYQIIWASQPL